MPFLEFEIPGKIRQDSQGNWGSDALGSVSNLISHPNLKMLTIKIEALL